MGRSCLDTTSVSGWRRVPAPPARSIPFIWRESLPLVGSAERPEDVRDVADPAERDREMKSRVLGDGCRREACEVDELILGREAAALRVVIARDAVLGE